MAFIYNNVEQNTILLAGGALVAERLQQVFGRTDGVALLLGIGTEGLRLGIELLGRQGATEMRLDRGFHLVQVGARSHHLAIFGANVAVLVRFQFKEHLEHASLVRIVRIVHILAEAEVIHIISERRVHPDLDIQLGIVQIYTAQVVCLHVVFAVFRLKFPD